MQLLTDILLVCARLVNNQKEAYQFQFNTIFPASSSQKEVCSARACPTCLHKHTQKLSRAAPKPLNTFCDPMAQVFDGVARSLVLQSLDGINGTIFAYGQTGSGKTFTITGGPQRYADRGIIPRAISLIFSSVAERKDTQYTVRRSIWC